MGRYRNITEQHGTVRIEFLQEGWHEIVNSSAVKAMVDDAGRKIAATAGDGFVYEPVYLARTWQRPGGIVAADSYEARSHEATSKVLTRAVNGG